MELFGFYIGNKDKLVKQVKDRLENELSQTLEQLVGKEKHDLKNQLATREAELTSLEKELSDTKYDFARNKERFDTLKGSIEILKNQGDKLKERVAVELIEATENYLKTNTELVLRALQPMRDQKNMPYVRAFFKKLYDIDELVSAAKGDKQHYGLKLLAAIETGCSGKIDVAKARALSWYAENELKNVGKEHRESAFDFLVETAANGKFDKALSEYNKSAVHRDYVLNLTTTEREIIRIRNSAFRGSWEAMLKTAQAPGRDTRTITLQDDPVQTAPLIRKLMDYEQQNKVILEYSGKDF